MRPTIPAGEERSQLKRLRRCPGLAEPERGKDNWFLHVNYWIPTALSRPGKFGNPFSEAPLPAWYGAETLKEHRKNAGLTAPGN